MAEGASIVSWGQQAREAPLGEGDNRLTTRSPFAGLQRQEDNRLTGQVFPLYISSTPKIKSNVLYEVPERS